MHHNISIVLTTLGLIPWGKTVAIYNSIIENLSWQGLSIKDRASSRDGGRNNVWEINDVSKQQKFCN